MTRTHDPRKVSGRKSSLNEKPVGQLPKLATLLCTLSQPDRFLSFPRSDREICHSQRNFHSTTCVMPSQSSSAGSPPGSVQLPRGASSVEGGTAGASTGGSQAAKQDAGNDQRSPLNAADSVPDEEIEEEEEQESLEDTPMEDVSRDGPPPQGSLSSVIQAASPKKVSSAAAGLRSLDEAMDQVLAGVLPDTHTGPYDIQDVVPTRQVSPPKMASSSHCFIVDVVTSTRVSRVLDVISLLVFIIVSSSFRPSISPQVWATLPLSPIYIQLPHLTKSTIWCVQEFTFRKLISWVIISGLHGTKTSPGFRTLVESIEERATTQLCHRRPFGFVITFPFDEVLTAALRRASAFRPSQVQELLRLILVVQVVGLPTVFRQQSCVEIIIFVHVNLISRSFKEESSRFGTADMYPRINSVTRIGDLEFHPEVIMHLFDPERTMPEVSQLTAQSGLHFRDVQPDCVPNLKARSNPLRQRLPLPGLLG
ncbi:unnamed protein product [Phytophthora fragariaefolia]|uniref:Unnamed protein product n=1 Tax=Phytophthora fragariaefolia TaxID=1490495 RepID=A0A9W7DA82_9STRA|nr:unnamed protein product [Phytophthora fragariaefolia]